MMLCMHACYALLVDDETDTSSPPLPATRDPRWHSPGLGGTPWADDRQDAEAFFSNSEEPWRQSMHEEREKLYRREKRMQFGKGELCTLCDSTSNSDNDAHTCVTVGTTLFYHHDIWQRQTPVHPKKLLRTVSAESCSEQ
jgi:hypothetical protein